MTSDQETKYRLEITRFHLRGAEEEWQEFQETKAGDHLAHCISQAQLCIENAAKSILTTRGLPSKSHNPSKELREMVEGLRDQFEHEFLSQVLELADWVEEVAPEHFRSNYGDEKRLILPSELYEPIWTEKVLNRARTAAEIASEFCSRWYGKGR